MYNSVCVHHASRAFCDILLIFNFFFLSHSHTASRKKVSLWKKRLAWTLSKEMRPNSVVAWSFWRRKKNVMSFCGVVWMMGNEILSSVYRGSKYLVYSQDLKHRVLRKVFKVKFLKACVKIAELQPVPSFFQRSGFPNICSSCLSRYL